MLRILTIFLFIAAALPANAETASPSFDCGRARTAVEKLICSDPDLARADRELAEGYRIARQFKNVDRASQLAWIKTPDALCMARPPDDCRAMIEAQIIALRTNAIVGVWGPGGRAFEMYGNMTVRGGKLTWKGCKPVPYTVLSYQRLDTYPGNPFKDNPRGQGPFDVVLLRVDDSPCYGKERYMQFAIPLDMREHADIVFYESPEQFEKQYFSWSGFGRRDLP